MKVRRFSRRWRRSLSTLLVLPLVLVPSSLWPLRRGSVCSLRDTFVAPPGQQKRLLGRDDPVSVHLQADGSSAFDPISEHPDVIQRYRGPASLASGDSAMQAIRLVLSLAAASVVALLPVLAPTSISAAESSTPPVEDVETRKSDWRHFLESGWRQALRRDEKAAWRRVPKSVLKRLRSVAVDLSDLQQDIYDLDWQNIAIYPNLLQAYVPVFTRYTDAAFPSDSAVDRELRVSLRYAVGAFYRHVRELEAAVAVQDLAAAEEAAARMSLSYDQYLKAGDLYEGYDPVTSTEIFYEGIPDSQLQFAPPLLEPPTIRDKVIVIVGPDKGKTGRILWVGEAQGRPKFAIVKLDYNPIIEASEVKTYEFSWVARTSGDQSTFVKDIVAAFFAAVVANTVTYPLDSYKVRLQAGKPGWPSEIEGGFQSLYKGLPLNLARQCPNASILMATFNFLQRIFLKALLMLPLFGGFSGATFVRYMVMIPAGALANATGSIIRVPFELINKQVQTGAAKDFKEAFQLVFMRPGSSTSYFASWATILVRDVPFGVVQLSSFELLKEVTATPLSVLHVDVFVQRLIWGFVAGGLASYITVPADNVSTRVMTESNDNSDISVPETVWRAAVDIWKEKGIEGFIVGGNIRALYYAPQNCVFFAVYDTLVNNALQ